MTYPPGPPQPPSGSSPYGSNPYPPGQPQYSNQPQYAGQPQYSGQPQYPGQPQYSNQPQYPNQPQYQAQFAGQAQQYGGYSTPSASGSNLVRILGGVAIALQLVIAGLCFGTWLSVDVSLFNSSGSKATGTFSGFGRVELDGKKVPGADADSPAIGTIIVAFLVLVVAIVLVISRSPMWSRAMGAVGAVLGLGSLGWLIVVWSDLPKYVAGVSNSSGPGPRDYSAGWGLIGCVVCLVLTIGLFAYAAISSFTSAKKAPPTQQPPQSGYPYPGQPSC
ncbi:hypothetical protein [Williamsia sp. CHRR-6]|uniref:hypothetical protein n=1 Tax=Williamsia sp. CHRR-6 TaxID=2835871 RepID=UPI001BD917CE|nr:hypothetical protein [Williamsia sp. CHRR-6]MBT0567416.1 hypothetical protein [Williamsia sp. CHRR-6]